MWRILGFYFHRNPFYVSKPYFSGLKNEKIWPINRNTNLYLVSSVFVPPFFLFPDFVFHKSDLFLSPPPRKKIIIMLNNILFPQKNFPS